MVKCSNCRKISFKKGIWYCEDDALDKDYNVFADDTECELYKPKRKFRKK